MQRRWRLLTHSPHPSLSHGKGRMALQSVAQIGCRGERRALVITWMHLSGLVYLLGSETCPLGLLFFNFLRGTNREVSSRHLSDDCSAELGACPLLLTSHSPDWMGLVRTRCSFILQSAALEQHTRARMHCGLENFDAGKQFDRAERNSSSQQDTFMRCAHISMHGTRLTRHTHVQCPISRDGFFIF